MSIEAVNTNRSGDSIVMNVMTPYSLFSSDNPGAMITSVSLTGENYNEWSSEMQNALRAKKKKGFIDGTIAKPDAAGADLESWMSVNSMVVGWLRTSITPRVRSTVSFITNAHDLWENLKKRFSVGNRVRVHHLRAQLAACRQGGDSVIDYYGKMAAMWDELYSYKPVPSCSCGAAATFAREREEEKVDQFVMGLNESRFATVIQSVIDSDPCPELEHVYSRVIREEQRLITSKTREATDAIGFATQLSIRGGDSISDSRGDSTGTRNRDRLLCSNCGRAGHEKSFCWKLIGYPDWIIERNARSEGRGGNRGGRGGGSTTGKGRAVVNTATATSPHPSVFPELTAEHWKAIIMMAQEKTGHVTKDKLSGKFAGDIIIDTGASHHMTGDFSLLVDVVDTSPCLVGFADGSKTISSSMGVLHITNAISLHNVLYVPDLNCSLISVSKLLKQLKHCCALFTDTLCIVQDRFTRTLIGAGEERDGVYYLTDVAPVRANRVGTVTDQALWHQRLGHPTFSVFSDLPFSISNSSSPSPCDVCFRAKQTREVFFDSSNKTQACFDLIHVDVWGPYRMPSSCGAVYFLTIVDDFSRSVWLHLLLEKSEVRQVLQNFCAYTEKQFGLSVKIVRSDNGTEFTCLSSFFKQEGIIHQTSCVGTPQQNGRVERKHRHILNVARSLLFQASLPTRFWGEAILASAHVINITPTKVLDGRTPHELLFGKKPSYDHLRVFGSACYTHLRSRDKDKFGPRSRNCVFMGYPFGKKGWKVFDLDTEEFLVSRDVVFRENVFPFQSMLPPVAPEVQQNLVDDDWFISPRSDDRGSSEELTHPSHDPDAETATTTSSPNPVSETPVAAVDSSLAVDAVLVSTSDQPPTDLTPAPTVDSSSEIIPLGRGLRMKQPPKQLDDYLLYNVRCTDNTLPVLLELESASSSTVPGNTPYLLEHYISDAIFSKGHQAFLAAVLAGVEPKSYKEALQDKVWRESMVDEIDAFEKNNTFSIVDLPEGKEALGNLWVYKIKYNADGTTQRHKSRLVVLGNHQVAGEDYSETFAPVAKMNTVRTLLKIIAVNKWEAYQMDVHNAFLHGDLEEEVYMKLPQGFRHSDPTKVCRLHKSLYGLKQAPRCWFAKLSTSLKEYGFTQSYKDYSLFIYTKDAIEMRVLVYVDDLLICGNNDDALSSFKGYLSTCFHMKDLGKIKYFLGLEVSRSDEGIFLSQRKYALEIIKETGMLGSKPVNFPMEQRHELGRDKSPFLTNPSRYRRLVGRLLYLLITRPDITFSVHALSQFMQAPREAHWEAALRVVRFLKSSPGQGVIFQSDTDLTLTAYCDSDWNSCPVSRRSLSAYFMLLGGSPVSWKTKKQDTVARSSAEAEYRSMRNALDEILWFLELLTEIGFPQQGPVRLFCDSQAAIYIAANPVFAC